MPRAIDEVVDKGETEGKLDGARGGEGHGGESGSDRGRLKVPAEEWGDEVGGEVGVGEARKGAAGDAGPGRVAEPGLLELVDAEVGGDGAVEALVDEDLVALGA